MSKQATDRHRATELVVSAAETHAERVGKAFEAEFSRYKLGREQMPDIGVAIKIVARALRDRRQTLTHTIDAHGHEAESSAQGFEVRDEAAAKLASEIAGIRVTVESVYGPAGLKVIGLDDKPAVEPKAVLEQAHALVKHLKTSGTKWPRPIRKGVKVHPKEWLAEVEGPIEALEQALQESAYDGNGRDRKDRMIAARAQAIAANDDLFRRASEFLSATFRLIGDETLARKVRPSTRRPGRSVSEPPGAETEAPAPVLGLADSDPESKLA